MFIIFMSSNPFKKNVAHKNNRAVADHGTMTMTLKFSAKF